MVQHQILGPNGNLIEVNLTLRTAVKAFCTECMGFERARVKDCTSKTCPLWPWRGASTAHLARRTLTPEQKAQAAARLAKTRLDKKLL